MNIYRIILANAFVLIVLGIYGYFSSGSPTALIAPAIGIVLIALAFPTKNENKTAAHIVVGLTLVSAIIFFITAFMRNNMIVLVMAIITFLALIMYILDFARRKKLREESSSESN
jgi:predicted membrane-bound mannosyltransferase